MDKENEGFDIMSFLFNNKSFIEGLIENLKKELEKLETNEEKKRLQKKLKISLAKIEAKNN